MVSRRPNSKDTLPERNSNIRISLILANVFVGHFVGINFRELGLAEDFAGIYFREFSLTKDFAGINFRESALYKDVAGVNLTFSLRNIFSQ